MILPGYINEALRTYYHSARDDRHALTSQDLFTDDPRECPFAYLPFFADEEGEKWSDLLSETEQRKIIYSSRDRHRHAGTVFAIKEMLRSIAVSTTGHEAEVVEYRNRDSYRYDIKRNGLTRYNGSSKHNDGQYIYDFAFTHWAEFYVVLKTSISRRQEILVKKLICAYQAKRSVLLGLITTRRQRDGAIYYDGQQTHGVL